MCHRDKSDILSERVGFIKLGLFAIRFDKNEKLTRFFMGSC